MHGARLDPLFARADAAVEEAGRLRADLNRKVAQAHAICGDRQLPSRSCAAPNRAALVPAQQPSCPVRVLEQDQRGSQSVRDAGMPIGPLDGRRVADLLELLRQRTDEEITAGVMALAGSLSPEMWRALKLLRLERSTESQKKAS